MNVFYTGALMVILAVLANAPFATHTQEICLLLGVLFLAVGQVVEWKRGRD